MSGFRVHSPKFIAARQRIEKLYREAVQAFIAGDDEKASRIRKQAMVQLYRTAMDQVPVVATSLATEESRKAARAAGMKRAEEIDEKAWIQALKEESPA